MGQSINFLFEFIASLCELTSDLLVVFLTLIQLPVCHLDLLVDLGEVNFLTFVDVVVNEVLSQ